jgi:hypothetical protein
MAPSTTTKALSPGSRMRAPSLKVAEECVGEAML